MLVIKTCWHRIFLLFFYFFFLFLSFPSPTFAAISFTLSNPQYQDNELTVDVSLSGLTSTSCSNSICYLQGAFTAQDKTKYFGSTQSTSGQWYPYISSPDPSYIQSDFFSFQPLEGNWSGTIKIKFDPQDAAYKGSGTYTLKVWRYTGKSSSPAGNAVISVNLASAAPTPTFIPTSTQTPSTIPTKTPTSKPTPIKSGPTATAKPVATTTPAPALTPAKSVIQQSSKEEDNIPTSILGEMVTASPSASPTIAGAKEASFFDLPKLFIGIGFVFLVGSGILAFRRFKNEK